jgi:transcriptional regulator with GAF, ATPase, and Fis domain
MTTRKAEAGSAWLRRPRKAGGAREAQEVHDDGPIAVLPIRPPDILGLRSNNVPLESIVRSVEIALIQHCLGKRASVRVAARRLGLTPAALSARMRRLGLPSPEQ